MKKFVNLTRACHPDCPFCARDWFKWFKGRMNMMESVRPRHKCSVSFAEAAATSIKPIHNNVRHMTGCKAQMLPDGTYKIYSYKYGTTTILKEDGTVVTGDPLNVEYKGYIDTLKKLKKVLKNE